MYVPYNVLMGRLNVMAWLYFMEKANRCSETDLADYDVVCPVFKRHYQLDQWSVFFCFFFLSSGGWGKTIFLASITMIIL